MSHRLAWIVLLSSLVGFAAPDSWSGWLSRRIYEEDFEAVSPTQTSVLSSGTSRSSSRVGVATHEKNDSRCLDLLPGHTGRTAIAWISPSFLLQPARHYRLSFDAKTRAAMLCGLLFRDAQGLPLTGDHNIGVEPCEQWTRQTFYFAVKYPATEGALAFYLMGQEPASIDNIRIEPSSLAEEREWYRQLAGSMKPVVWTAPENAGRLLPRTLARLHRGGALKVVLFGDSIANDLSNSSLANLLEERYPRAKVELRFTGKGGTSWVNNEAAVEQSVLAHKPDLVILLAISNDAETMRDPLTRIIRTLREGAPLADLLLVTPHVFPTHARQPWVSCGQQRETVLEVAGKEGVEVVDLFPVWQSYLAANDKPAAWLLRDEVHMNERGRLLAASVVAAQVIKDYGSGSDSIGVVHAGTNRPSCRRLSP